MKKLDTALMTWGTGGGLDYAVMAIKASIGLSIKFYGLADGAMVKAPGQTYAVFRMRSSDVGDTMEQLGLEVTHDDAVDPKNAWPACAWQKGDATYRSTSIGFLIPAHPADPIALSEALDQIDVVPKLLAMMTKLAGSEDAIAITPDGLKGYLDGNLFKVKAKIAETAEAKKAGKSETTPQAPGEFFNEADILQKMAQIHSKAPDLDAMGVKDGDGEGDHEEGPEDGDHED